MEFGKNSYIGFGLIVIAIVLAFLVASLTTIIQEVNVGSCGMEADVCPHARNIPVETAVGYGMSLVLGFIGIYLITVDLRKAKIGKESTKNWNKVISALQGEEKNIYGLIASADGVMFQSDIVEKSEMQKVKVSRVLDRLEARNLVERRRRGMSNVVVLKSTRISHKVRRFLYPEK